MIECNKFIVSTNGGAGRSCHPDRESIANIVCHEKRNKLIPVELYFNYEKDKIEKRGYKFINEGEDNEYSFVIYDDIQILP